MRKERVVVVTGATGRQGAAVARHCLAAGFDVRAVVRNPDAPAAARLRQAGAATVRADFDDVEGLRSAFRGAEALFSMQSFWEAGYVKEFLQARNALDAAKAEGLAEIVYSSAAIDSGAGLPHIETKAVIEALTRHEFPNSTILRPVWFMEGAGPGYFDVDRRLFTFVTAPGRAHGWISVDDIGRFAVRAFLDPGTYAGLTLNLASRFSTGEEMASAFGRGVGMPLQYEAWDEAKTDAMVHGYLADPVFARELRRVYDFIRDVNFTVDDALIDRYLPERHTLDSWVREIWAPSRPAPFFGKPA